jgi:hypothetical protein
MRESSALPPTQGFSGCSWFYDAVSCLAGEMENTRLAPRWAAGEQ